MSELAQEQPPQTLPVDALAETKALGTTQNQGKQIEAGHVELGKYELSKMLRAEREHLVDKQAKVFRQKYGTVGKEQFNNIRERYTVLADSKAKGLLGHSLSELREGEIRLDDQDKVVMPEKDVARLIAHERERNISVDLKSNYKDFGKQTPEMNQMVRQQHKEMANVKAMQLLGRPLEHQVTANKVAAPKPAQEKSKAKTPKKKMGM